MEESEELGDPQSELFQTPDNAHLQPASDDGTPDTSEPVTEADPALVKPENSNAGLSATDPTPGDINEPEAAGHISGTPVIPSDER